MTPKSTPLDCLPTCAASACGDIWAPAQLGAISSSPSSIVGRPWNRWSCRATFIDRLQTVVQQLVQDGRLPQRRRGTNDS